MRKEPVLILMSPALPAPAVNAEIWAAHRMMVEPAEWMVMFPAAPASFFELP